MAKIAFIGAGNMAGAIVEGILRGGTAAPGDIAMADVSEARLAEVAAKYGVGTSRSNAGAVRGADTVVLAVKPQQLAEAVAQAGDAFSAGQLVASICAGVTTFDCTPSPRSHRSTWFASEVVYPGSCATTVTASSSEPSKSVSS